MTAGSWQAGDVKISKLVPCFKGWIGIAGGVFR